MQRRLQICDQFGLRLLHPSEQWAAIVVLHFHDLMICYLSTQRSLGFSNFSFIPLVSDSLICLSHYYRLMKTCILSTFSL